jgi:CheY-like chemotaxis protein
MGCGMDAETRERAFEPFFTTKPAGAGTGLGLAAVHGLVGQHRGAIDLRSVPGEGTTITIHLPAAAGEEVTGTTPDEARASGGTETILLAEDHELIRKLTQVILESAGYAVLAARDGADAIRLIADRAQHLDLAMVDVVMPRLGSEAVFRNLRRHRPGIPVLFACASSSQDLQLDLASHERVGLVQKPYGRDELLRKIREVLRLPG